MKDRHDEERAIQVDPMTDVAFLRAENERLRLEITQLQSLLDSKGIVYSHPATANAAEAQGEADDKSPDGEPIISPHAITKRSALHEKASLFLSYFPYRQ